ncbi:hypothetical protein CSB45_09675 [candidate division KSB3 bacterium]|uniref:Sulfotransferase n=1 Tax=candidate division KSB3 bacterium TaxID=2044937 RepID=A0A2G6E4C0_9BACT|nr:MAG: hypothetical protein CSB45_09675 [candidate division KSB3 bacterium]PIE29415.1 MAG: hypothetical protein CSA57_08400 [candidate division KSB3 bacterium]
MQYENISHINFLSQSPIFIVGSPRSGTTLLQSILSSQNGLYSIPETHFFSNVYKSINLDRKRRIDVSCLEECFKKIQQKMDIMFSSHEKDMIILQAEEKKLSPRILFEIIVKKCIHQNIAIGEKAFRLVEKTPNHVYCLDRILSYYPEAQFVNIIRHPIAVVNSRKRHFPYNRDTTVEKLAALWIKSIKSIEDFEKNHQDKIYTLRYEDLMKNPEDELSKLGAFLCIDIKFSLWKSYQKRENNFILLWETWKECVKSNEFVNTNSSYLREMSLLEILKVQRLVKNKIKAYEYELSFPFWQQIFNYWFRHKSVVI